MSNFHSPRRPGAVRAAYRPHNRSQQHRRPSGGYRAGAYIDPARFVRAAKPVAQEAYKSTHSFADFKLNPQLAANVTKAGFSVPTPIQDQAIPHGLAGEDVVGIANTGTGKTIAFALPVLNKLMSSPANKALVVAPTRELAEQIEKTMAGLARSSGLRGSLLIGGSSMSAQIRELRANPALVIGTPGRIKDHLERRNLDLRSFNVVVVDEVDRMMDMGFINDIRELLALLKTPRQSFFFSATVDGKIASLINTFAQAPVTLTVKTGDTADNVEQSIIRYQGDHDKIEKLHDTLIKGDVSKTLIFDATKHRVDKLAKVLQERGFNSDALHGGKTQGQRQRALRRFKENQVSVLVATDVAARGIDVLDISHVINYALPQSYDDYVHRIGRTGRAGKAGTALTFVNN